MGFWSDFSVLRVFNTFFLPACSVPNKVIQMNSHFCVKNVSECLKLLSVKLPGKISSSWPVKVLMINEFFETTSEEMRRCFSRHSRTRLLA